MSHFDEAEVQNHPKKSIFKVSVLTATPLFILKAHLRFSRKLAATSAFAANFRHSNTKKKKWLCAPFLIFNHRA